MKKLIVKNPKLQSKLDKIGGWKEVVLVILVLAFTAFVWFIAWKFQYL